MHNQVWANMATGEPVEMCGHAGKDKYRASTDEGPLQHTHTAWNVMILPDFTLYMAAGREGASFLCTRTLS